jgi:phage recombination protein Bet
MSTTTQQQNVPVLQQIMQDEKGKISYQVAGQDVILSFSIVKNYLTRGKGNVTDQELVQFISICKFNQLNPFLNEAYLVKFEGVNAQAQMVVSKEALMKRAENSPEYDGLRAGLIVKRGSDIVEVEGSFSLPTDVMLGGWAEVWRKDKKYPYVSRVSLAEYDKKQSTWNDKKSTMIRKTAIVQALREAFPTQLGAMYTAEEQGIKDVPYEDVTGKVANEVENKANAGEQISFSDPAAEQTAAHVETQEQSPAGSGEQNGNKTKIPGF